MALTRFILDFLFPVQCPIETDLFQEIQEGQSTPFLSDRLSDLERDAQALYYNPDLVPRNRQVCDAMRVVLGRYRRDSGNL